MELPDDCEDLDQYFRTRVSAGVHSSATQLRNIYFVIIYFDHFNDHLHFFYS